MESEFELKFYNTKTKQKELFKPNVAGKVGMYVCGVTPYDQSHIGHARSAVVYDLLYRFLKSKGYEVRYVRNFTDIDDKIIGKANEIGVGPKEVSDRYINEYHGNMKQFQCLPPTEEPRVTDHIEQIKNMIHQIIKNEFAYAFDGNVYFKVDKSPNYGQLSGNKKEDTRVGEPGPGKRDPADFALWKAAKPGEISWHTDWGEGRPGWHIECSAMSNHYLTSKFDIHGGGSDLIFPHHENEVAQSWAFCADSDVGYWMHNGTVNINGRKMSKSERNYVTIREATNVFHPLALRYYLMSTHYRSPFNYMTSQLAISSEAVFHIYQTLQDCEDVLAKYRGHKEETEPKQQITFDAQDCLNKLRRDFQFYMSDDLHTPEVLNAVLQDALRFINRYLNLPKKQQRQKELSQIQSLIEVRDEVEKVLQVLGLFSPMTYSQVLQEFKEKALKRANLTEQEVLHQIEERATARKNKDYSRADQIRGSLAAKGIGLMDEGKLTIWRPCLMDQENLSQLVRIHFPLLHEG